MIKAGFTLAAAFAFAASAVAQETIKIGVIADRVGVAKPWSEPISLGAVYAAKELNAKGGILGMKVELLIEDDQGKSDVSATAARKLQEAGAAFILSITHTPAALQAQKARKRLEAAGVEVVGPLEHGGFVTSIYFADPNGARLELTTPVAGPEKLAGYRSTARAALDAWTREKRSKTARAAETA